MRLPANMACVDLSDDFVRVADNLGIDGGNITLAIWITLDVAVPTGEDHILINQGNTTSQTHYAIMLRDTAGTEKLRFIRTKPGVAEQAFEVDNPFTVGTWYHVALTYDGTNVEGYVDGVSQGTVAASGTGSSGAVNEFSSGVWRNASPTVGVGDFRIAHMLCYSSALSVANINRISKSKPPDNETGLLVYWPLDENTGTTATDHAGTATNGTLTGGDWVAGHPYVTYK